MLFEVYVSGWLRCCIPLQHFLFFPTFFFLPLPAVTVLAKGRSITVGVSTRFFSTYTLPAVFVLFSDHVGFVVFWFSERANSFNSTLSDCSHLLLLCHQLAISVCVWIGESLGIHIVLIKQPWSNWRRVLQLI